MTHKRNVTCPRCESNLKALFFYDNSGNIKKANGIFYCTEEDKMFRISFTEVKE